MVIMGCSGSMQPGLIQIDYCCTFVCVKWVLQSIGGFVIPDQCTPSIQAKQLLMRQTAPGEANSSRHEHLPFCKEQRQVKRQRVGAYRYCSAVIADQLGGSGPFSPFSFVPRFLQRIQWHGYNKDLPSLVLDKFADSCQLTGAPSTSARHFPHRRHRGGCLGTFMPRCHACVQAPMVANTCTHIDQVDRPLLSLSSYYFASSAQGW
jgi:hypothetical protein